ncbi:MAG TPA: DUF5522 domain-containing protein [Byssovorax sp.]|jgi:hypothetical protein
MTTARLPKLVEGVDYYVEEGKFVFRARYHRRRGHCCNSRCRHCPYGLGNPDDGIFASDVGITVIGLPGDVKKADE